MRSERRLDVIRRFYSIRLRVCVGRFHCRWPVRSLAGATGYWNMPGTMCQWCGCGYRRRLSCAAHSGTAHLRMFARTERGSDALRAESVCLCADATTAVDYGRKRRPALKCRRLADAGMVQPAPVALPEESPSRSTVGRSLLRRFNGSAVPARLGESRLPASRDGSRFLASKAISLGIVVLVFGLCISARLRGWLWALLRPTLFARRVERALRQFVRDREALEAAFFKAASASWQTARAGVEAVRVSARRAAGP